MKDIEYWKKELRLIHPTEYIALIEAITEVNHCRHKEKLKAEIHEILDDESALSCLDEDEWKSLLSKIDKTINGTPL